MSAVADGGVDAPAPAPRAYDVLKQRVDIDVDFPRKSLKGSTELTLQPHVKDLKQIALHCRQCKISQVQVGGIAAQWYYDDPYSKPRHLSKATVHQHAMLKSRIQAALRPSSQPQLEIILPSKLKIQELRPDPAIVHPLVNGPPALQKQELDAIVVENSLSTQGSLVQAPLFAPIKVTVEFELDRSRDGIHWIGCDEEDQRYPVMYTKLQPWVGNTSSIFPCLDDATAKCLWEFAVRCPRTLGDTFRKPQRKEFSPPGIPRNAREEDVVMVNGTDVPADSREVDEYLIDLDAQDAGMEMTVLCVGEQTDDIADSEDDSRHTVVFNLNDVVTARHVAFAIGPFEHVDLTNFRAAEEESKLGQTAVKVDGYCLPGRLREVENTCYPICKAVDHISVNCGRFPFATYQVLFLDDLVQDTAGAAGITFCSTRLLFPEDVIEPLDRHTRILVRAVAEQWSGVNIVPKEPSDAWVTSGIAGFLTDAYMKHLAGNNQYRWEQKLAAEKVYELDVERPSIYQLGPLLHLDPSIPEFVDLKSAVVLGILDRRLIKASGSTGVLRIINKIFLNAKTGTLTNGELSTQDFQRTCEKLGHNKLESFFRQWVLGAGCPIFHVQQKFNKKKLCVEMSIHQRQLERQTKPPFEPSNFMREVKEHIQEVWAPETQSVFTGPMTIRIHEADGTPYEHIVEIKEPYTKLEIPYNTKYKRLKRSKRQKERAVAEGAAGEGDEATLLYCLGDILDSKEDARNWNLADWSEEDQERMGQESYEWIRMDADFEWIGKIHLVMPLYMYISQLQQDRDLVAQYESMRYLLGSNPHHVSLTILVRTLMDARYFYGIRVMATEGLAMLAKDKLTDIGKHHLMKAFMELYCEGGDSAEDVMPRPNDFSDRRTFIMQCAIPKAMARLRDSEDKVPKDVRNFFVSLLEHNDNSDNSVSDCHYVATLLTCLADSMVASHREVQVKPTYTFAFGEEGEEDHPEPINFDADAERKAINVIERYRRLDEYIMTYQNIYSTTAIECLQKLSKVNIVQDKMSELVQYTRPSTANNVRLAAFRCLNEVGMVKKPSIMKLMLIEMCSDPSPYFRERLLRLFGEALGHIALGEAQVEHSAAPAPSPAPAFNDEGLILVEASSNEARRIEATRKSTPEGAIAALKALLHGDESFKETLWYAMTSENLATKFLSLDEIASLCDIAALIFDAVTSQMIVLPLPRPYRCEYQGKGRLRFYQTGRIYRTQPSKGLDWESYEALESYGLQYTGPLSKETKRRVHERQEASEQQCKRAQAEAERARADSYAATTAFQQSLAYQAMPPPATPASVVQTPTEQKSGFKLNLGGPKRKPSVDLGAQREASPKVIKLNKLATPGATPKNTASGGRRRSITPGSGRAGKSMLVILNLGIVGSRKARDIVSRPPQPGRVSSAPPPPPPPTKKIVPVRTTSSSQLPSLASASLQQKSMSHAPPSTIAHLSPTNGAAWSPPSASLTALPAQNLNLGGFRSFGGSGSGSPSLISPTVASPGDTGKQKVAVTTFRSLSGPAASISPPPARANGSPSSGHSHAHPPSLTGRGITSLSSLSPTAPGDGSMAAPPPKRKITLKLGARKPSDTSQPPTPGGATTTTTPDISASSPR